MKQKVKISLNKLDVLCKKVINSVDEDACDCKPGKLYLNFWQVTNTGKEINKSKGIIILIVKLFLARM